MILQDFHTHTRFSSDSEAEPEAMIEKAISLGLKRYCITDHMDYCYPHPEIGTFLFDPEEYVQELTRLKEKYKSQIDLNIGIELGLRNEPDLRESIRTQYEQLITSYPFDFVLGSTHVILHYDPYLKEFWNNRTTHEGIFEYFRSIEQNAAYYPMFQIYGHLDYIVRYIPDLVKEYCPSDYQDVIDSMLRSLIEHGKGIECNAAGLKYGLPFPHPKPEILKRYLELGGELITIGSDAHKPEHIAYEFLHVSELLKELGFRYYAIYKEQKPEMIRL